MSYNYEYPYTSANANADWILKKIKELGSRVDNIKAEFLTEANVYTDEAIASSIGSLRAEVEALRVEVNREIDNMEGDINNFKNLVNAQLDVMRQTLNSFDRRINSAVAEANNYTALAIQQNNDYIISEVSKGVAVKVVNPASGALETIQEVVNYLFSLHTNNAITYEVLADKNITYDALSALNITYEQLAINGNILIP